MDIDEIVCYFYIELGVINLCNFGAYSSLINVFRNQESGVRSQNESFQYHFLGRKSSFLSNRHILKNIFIALTIRNILFEN